MSKRLFGTDGVRGLANKVVTARLALRLGESAARVLTKDVDKSRKRAVVGNDSRVSGEMLSSAVSAGLTSAGVDVINIGILPTPGISFITSSLGVDLGVVISASHNAMPDNGIKFFRADGLKLDDKIEDEIEELLEKPWDRPTGKGIGRTKFDHDSAQSAYISHLVSAIENANSETKKPLQNLKIVVDCANGAASSVAPEALRLAGAEVIVINASPDGFNINENCGSTHPEQLFAMVKASNADFGVAFDGDADRCIACDENGQVVDGDKIISLLAVDLKSENKLKNSTVVLTVMSNLGTLNYLKKNGIIVETTAVGDRYVLENMIENGHILGGEQSGHIINLLHSTTGDGTLSALMLANLFAKERNANPDVKFSDLANQIEILPQILINVKNVDKSKVDDNLAVQNVVKEVEERLGQTGRVLLRPSGTENLVRVMVEGPTQELTKQFASQIAAVVETELKIKE